MLAYPSFDKDFALETDASIQGIGAVLSQQQSDGHLHPVAYTSRALYPAESHYSITELETLAVVWAITYFHSYLYGHLVIEQCRIRVENMPDGGPESMVKELRR